MSPRPTPIPGAELEESREGLLDKPIGAHSADLAGHEAQGALYRRLHALGADGDTGADTLLYVIAAPAHAHG